MDNEKPDLMQKDFEKYNIYSKKHKLKQYEFEKLELKAGIPLYLNVYSISSVNKFFQIFGFGIFHTAVEIKQIEYSFGSTNGDYSGVIAIPSGSLGFELKEKIYLGNTLYKLDEIRYIAYLINFSWRGHTYDPFIKNCNNFTKFFAEFMLKTKVNYPVYINRFNSLKIVFKCFYEPFRTLVGDIVTMQPAAVISNSDKDEKTELKDNKNKDEGNKEDKSEDNSEHNESAYSQDNKLVNKKFLYRNIK